MLTATRIARIVELCANLVSGQIDAVDFIERVEFQLSLMKKGR